MSWFTEVWQVLVMVFNEKVQRNEIQNVTWTPAGENPTLPKLVPVRWDLLRHACSEDNRRKCSLLVLVKVLPRSNDRFSQFPDIQTCLRIPKGKKKKKEVSHFESPTTVLQSISSGYRLQAPGSSQVKCGHVLIIKYGERGWSKSLRLIITYWKDEGCRVTLKAR